ncbi:MAG: methyltransferase domain-containing protein [Chloroflexi bacterium]|nr:methyltransferase domain-containing protein [Chloroflexota bacterium]
MAVRAPDSTAWLEFTPPDEGNSWLRHLESPAGGTPFAQDEAYGLLLDDLRTTTGVDFRQYRQPSIHRLLQVHLAALDFQSVRDYQQFAHHRPAELRQLATRLLVRNGTFFRDPLIFQYLEDVALPRLWEQSLSQRRPLRAWSAGCGSGEEAYSLGILLAEGLESHPGASVEFIASDVDVDGLAIARAGWYSRHAVDRMPVHLRSRYLLPEGRGYRVDLSEGFIQFEHQDLLQGRPAGRFDLILCRYVVMFFDNEPRQRVVSMLSRALQPEGWLVFGAQELPPPVLAGLTPVASKRNVFLRRTGSGG